MTRNERLAAADQEAADCALEAGPEAIMAGAADAEAGPAVLADLLAHELAAGHRLMLRLVAAADVLLDWSAESADAADCAAAELGAAQLAATASRLMEQLRQGAITLRRLRPEMRDDDELWIALSWLDGRCSPEELEHRVAAARAARAANNPAAAPALSPRAQAARALAAEEAAALAAEARAGVLADAAADEQGGSLFLAGLLAHELGAVHALQMRFTGRAQRAVDRAAATVSAPTLANRLAAIAARLTERFRRGVLTLLSFGIGPDGKPRKVTGMVWGGPDTPANDPTDAPFPAPFPAGHGVHRSDLLPVAG